MLPFILRRVTQAVPVLILVSFAVFSIMFLLPGDAATLMLQDTGASAEAVARLRAQLGLDQPPHMQYLRFVGNVLQGDLGTSLQSGRTVAQELRSSLPPTIELALAAMLVAILVGFATGILASLMRNTWGDTLMTGIALFGISMPNFWLGLMLIFLFSINLQWFPVGGTGGLDRLVLPAVTLGFAFAGSIARLTRSSMLEVLDQDYVRTARAKGVFTRTLVLGHAFRNALLPVVTVLGLQLGQLLAGTVVVEFVFARQGLGSLLLASILTKDFQVVQIGILFAAIVYLVTNLLVDILYTFIDPRIRRA